MPASYNDGLILYNLLKNLKNAQKYKKIYLKNVKTRFIDDIIFDSVSTHNTMPPLYKKINPLKVAFHCHLCLYFILNQHD